MNLVNIEVVYRIMKENYYVVMSKFLGESGTCFKYELTMSKSFVHTGRMDFMCKALDYYEATESKNLLERIKAVYKLIKSLK